MSLEQLCTVTKLTPRLLLLFSFLAFLLLFLITLQLGLVFLECFFAGGTLHAMFFDNTCSRFLETDGTGITDDIFAL